MSSDDAFDIPLLIGAVLGLLSVMIAAYIDHTLALHLTGKSLSSLLTAVRYHGKKNISMEIVITRNAR